MQSQLPARKSFFARYWGWFAGGAALLAVACVAGLALLYLFVLRGNAKVTEIDLSADVPVQGEELKAIVTLENTGVFSMDYGAELTVDGKKMECDPVKLASREPRTIELDLSGLADGKHTMRIGGIEKDFRVFRPASFEVTDLMVEPETVMAGETLNVYATIRNTGEVKGVFSARPTCDGAAMGSMDVPVGREDAAPLSFQWVADGRGERTIELGECRRKITVLLPASIAVADMTLSAPYVQVNGEIYSNVQLTNAGDVSGIFPLQVTVNGEVVYQRDIEVPGNGGTNWPVPLTPGNAGQYDVTVGGFTQTFHAVTLERPKSGTVIVNTANGGSGRLTVINNNDRDIVVVLSALDAPGTPLLSVYVQAGSKASNVRVRDGTYCFYYVYGEDWDSASRRFMKNPSYGKFDDPGEFKTTSRYYSIYTLTMKTSEGSSPTSSVNEDAFPH